jgi:multidrug efflux pump subunit AcrA (membrane-fusion protein)
MRHSMTFERPWVGGRCLCRDGFFVVGPCRPWAAQQASPAASVGVTKVERTAVTETTEFIGRIQAVDRPPAARRRLG